MNHPAKETVVVTDVYEGPNEVYSDVIITTLYGTCTEVVFKRRMLNFMFIIEIVSYSLNFRILIMVEWSLG